MDLKDKYNFICVNFSNPDMVGHTGNVNAAKKAISIVDDGVKKVIDVPLNDASFVTFVVILV